MPGALSEAMHLLPQLIRWRRHLHQHPEPSFEEHQTQQYLLSELHAIPHLQVATIAGTGIIADMVTDPAGPWIALRADMDALPISEKAGRPYRSLREGYMHACGHDAHMAMLLGAIHLLSERRSEWKGAIRFIFQPGEEKSPGGASLLVQAGVLSSVPVQAIWGMHVTPQLPVGTVGLRAGAFMAASDEIYIRLKGTGGHAAYPHLTPDPVTVGAYVLTQLQMVVSRAADPRLPTVLTFGRFHAGTAPNIIPTEAELAGTLRTFDESWRQQAKALIATVIRQTVEPWQLAAEIDFRSGYPVLYNDPTLTARTREWIAELLGETAVQELPLWLSSEDFAFYSQHVPACFIRLGTAGDHPDTQRPVHTPDFDIDEQALAVGAAIWAHLAIKALRFFVSTRAAQT